MILSSPQRQNKNNFDFYTDGQLEKYSVYNLAKIDNTESVRTHIQDIMWDYVGIIRDEKSLLLAKARLESIAREIDLTKVYQSIEENEIVSLLLTSQVVVEMALSRKESRGSHYRVDFPQKQEKVSNQFYLKGQKNDKIFIA